MSIKIDFAKYPDGLAPAIVQDASTRVVLMLGYMNEDALMATQSSGKVTFFSRSRGTLWVKGETSGNFLFVKEILSDCDQDALLIKADPVGVVCHTGADTCFKDANKPSFLFELEDIIAERKNSMSEGSYTASLFRDGLPRIAQKVGEEAVEVVIEAMGADDDRFRNEAADLLFHLLVLLQAKGQHLTSVESILEARHR